MFRKFLSTVLALALLMAAGITGTNPSVSAADPPPNWTLVQPAYPTMDTVVAAYNVQNFGATGDGVTDVTSIFQDLLDALGRLGGGTLFVPSGRYVIRGNLVIPKGVTLRGEWKKPVKGQPIEGTILMAYAGRGNENAAAFLTLETSSAVMDLAIWYPEQLPGNITPYPPAILFGKPNYWGNDYPNAKNITLVNAYSGVILSRQTGGGCPVIQNIYGTPLSRGIEIDNIADVGRIDFVDFSPAYWAGSGLPNAPSSSGPHVSWIYQNGTGIVMRRNDWSYTCYVNIEGYNRGLYVGPSISSPGSTPNGHNYELTFTGCKTGIQFDVGNDVGIMYARTHISNCETGIRVASSAGGVIQLNTCDISATNSAITIEEGSNAKLMLQQCTVANGSVTLSGGTFTAVDCDFNNSAPQIVLNRGSRSILTGNRFGSAPQIQNNSNFESTIDHNPVSIDPLPSFPTMTPQTRKPTRLVLYNAAAAPFYAVNDGVTDNTSAIQNALNTAAAAGGGVVFLPPGKYKVLGTLTVPSNVELKGASDISTAPTGKGTIIEVYAGKGNPSSSPFLKLSANSGVRGITFNYPEQVASALPNIPAYPYLIQVTGSNAYIINVAIRATYSGIDLFTYKCDNHYVDWVAGHVFKTGVRVGNNSANGVISNLQFNIIAYAAGQESKWGSWPNSPSPGNTSAPYDYAMNNLDFMVLGSCSNQILYNNFHYGSYRGTIFSGASGKGLGHGVDGARKGLRYESLGSGGFPLINSQIVVIQNQPGTYYLETASGFGGTASLFNADFWGQPVNSIYMSGGTLNLHQANFNSSGSAAFAHVGSGLLKLNNSAVRRVNPLLTSGSEPRFSVQNSIIDPLGINPGSCALWKNNQGNSPTVSLSGALDRTGWTATASHNNGNAYRALDGNSSTRWDTAGSQTSGQWFTVDMKGDKIIDRIVLETYQSPDDSPAGYSVYLSTDGTNWGSPIASGTGTTGVTDIIFPKRIARYIRIVQTGSKGNYWSIHEFYAFGSNAPNAATFYQDVDYGGAAISLPPGNYTTAQLAAAGIPDNWVSSIRVPSGFTVEIYDNDNFTGTKWTFTADHPNFVAAGLNDRMSSVKIMAPSNYAPIGMVISLKCVANNQYVCSENGGSDMNCNRTAVGAWEKFRVVDTGDGKIALKGYANDVAESKYVCSENGQVPMICNRDALGSWERFEWINNSDGTISLKGNNNLYVTGSSPMWCNATSITSTEKFQYAFH